VRPFPGCWAAVGALYSADPVNSGDWICSGAGKASAGMKCFLNWAEGEWTMEFPVLTTEMITALSVLGLVIVLLVLNKCSNPFLGQILRS